MKKGLATVILALVTAGGVAAVLLRGDLSGIFSAITSADLKLVLLAVGMYFLEVFFLADRWRVALTAVGYNTSFPRMYLIAHSGMFFSNIMPMGTISGQPFSAYIIKKTQDVPYPIGFATILAGVILSIPVFLLLLLAGMAFWIHLQSPPLWVSAAILATITCLLVASLPIAYALVERKSASGGIFRIMRWISKRSGRETNEGEIMRPIRNFYRITETVLYDRKNAVMISIIALLLELVTMMRIWLILFALGQNVSIAVPLLAVTLPLLAAMVPFLPGGLVLVEASMIGVFVACGLPLTIAISATLIERSISYVLATVVGAWATSYLGIEVWRRK